jgi:hypothetical protein
MKLFHVSETPGIAVFEPRPADDGVAKVWAIEQRALGNYLLPRDCPRVCFRRGKATDPAELSLLDGAEATIAIEAAWLERVRATTLFVYNLPADGFALEDETAGYWTSRRATVPTGREVVTDLPNRIAEAGARLIVIYSLWPLHYKVRDSALAFSMIRMRNAASRP